MTTRSDSSDSVAEISPEKQLKSPPLTTEPTDSDSVKVSSFETNSLVSNEDEAMIVVSPQTLYLPQPNSSSREKPSSEIAKEADQIGVDEVDEVVVVPDGSVVSLSETNGFDQESFVLITLTSEQEKRVLEAEKTRLLAEIETGSIFKKKDVDMVACSSDLHKTEKKESVRVKDNVFVGRSMKIELVDDTALLNVVPFNKKDHVKRPGGLHSEKDVPRKHKKKAAVYEFGNGRRVYTRKEMESMRYVNVGEQKKVWSDMYAGLVPELVSEYEGLVYLRNQKNSKAYGNGTKEGMNDLTLEEEEYTEDTDDYTSILRPAFAVDGEPDFESGPPEDGLEYLRRVRWEAKQIPNVRVAKIDETNYIKKEQSVYMPQIPEIPKCPEHLLPVKEWEDSLLSDFLYLRQALSENGNEYEDELMFSTEDVLAQIFNNRIHTSTDESLTELVSDMQGSDSVTRVSKLKKRISLVEKENGLESNDFKWVVALCASVDTPIDADTSASLRALLRKCASLRASEVQDEQVIIMANMLITIAGRFFGQME